MTDAKQCDRCDEFYKEEDFSAMAYTISDMGSNKKDMCKQCLYDVEEFMDKPVIKGKKRKAYTRTDGSREKMVEQGRCRTDIAKLIQSKSDNMTWSEALKKSCERIKVAKEQGVTIEELKDSIEKNTIAKPTKEEIEKCSICDKTPVDNKGEICKQCSDDIKEFEKNL